MLFVIWKPNVTVASVIEQDGRFLMVKERAADMLVYNQPAGHLDEGESLLNAAIRETREETAWEFVPEAVIGIYRWVHDDSGLTFLRIAFCGHALHHHAEQPLDEGIVEALWLSHEALLEHAQHGRLRSPLVLRCVDDYRAGIRYPLSILQDVF
ncbi:NUDIX hydrolase [Thiorhodospira sibirica]|uniref:NUDIX hydrolase n=1 Tax=Thiorhodospira sibirica TaxID=154347 RepID=UPI00030EEACA